MCCNWTIVSFSFCIDKQTDILLWKHTNPFPLIVVVKYVKGIPKSDLKNDRNDFEPKKYSIVNFEMKAFYIANVLLAQHFKEIIVGDIMLMFQFCRCGDFFAMHFSYNEITMLSDYRRDRTLARMFVTISSRTNSIIIKIQATELVWELWSLNFVKILHCVVTIFMHSAPNWVRDCIGSLVVWYEV